MKYVLPGDVLSPAKFWKLHRVVYDAGAGLPAFACGTWEGEEVVAMRWNGGRTGPKGSPVSSGFPTWIMLPRGFGITILNRIRNHPPASDLRLDRDFAGQFADRLAQLGPFKGEKYR